MVVAHPSEGASEVAGGIHEQGGSAIRALREVSVDQANLRR